MIISLEGSRASGKSYILQHIKKKLPDDIVYTPTPEQAEWINKNSPPFEKTYVEARSAEDWFFGLIADRFRQSLYGKINFFERDYLSSLSFSYAYSSITGLDVYSELFKQYEKNLSRGIFQKPDIRIILDNNYELFIQRAKNKDPKRQSIWFNQPFADKLFEYYRIFAREMEAKNSVITPVNSTPEFILEIINPFLSRA